MSSDGRLERLWKVSATVNKLILDGRRDPDRVSDALQAIIDTKDTKSAVIIVESPKFALLVDLGIITIPVDNSLATFRQNNREKFYGYNEDITDKHFPNPTRVLKPGDRLRVKVFQQVVPGTTTSKERLSFLKSQKAVLVGAQGLPPVFEQKRDHLPMGKWYASFDTKSHLWRADGDRKVPVMDRVSGGGFYWGIGYFEVPWHGGHAFFCFCLPD